MHVRPHKIDDESPQFKNILATNERAPEVNRTLTEPSGTNKNEAPSVGPTCVPMHLRSNRPSEQCSC
jgi:hypothetical protein